MMTTHNTAGTEGQRKERSDAHTPGPWTVQTWTYNNGSDRLVIQTAHDAICDVHAPWRPDERISEQKANAALIAAAPELLNCLRDVVFSAVGVEGLDAGLRAISVDQVRQYKGVLAKAEGCSTMTPTARPWAALEHLSDVDITSAQRTICRIPKTDEDVSTDAAHIVHCVNTYDALVEALEAVLPYVPGWNAGDHAARPWLDKAKAALGKANGQ